MKLKKSLIMIICIIVAVSIGVGEYYILKNKEQNAYQLIIIAGKNIKKGEQITIDKLSLAKVSLETPINVAKTKAEVLNKYTPYEIKVGEPLIPNKLLKEPVYEKAYNEYSAIIKIDPIPYGFISKNETVKLMFISNEIKLANDIVSKDKNKIQLQTPLTYIFDNVKIGRMYDSSYNDFEQLESINNNEYKKMTVMYLEVIGDKSIIQKIKEYEKVGTYIVIKK